MGNTAVGRAPRSADAAPSRRRSTLVVGALAPVGALWLAPSAIANHPVILEGNCNNANDPAFSPVPAPGTCGDYDGDGAIGTAEEDRVTATVEGYFDAISERDYARACELVADPYEQTIADFAAESFPRDSPRGCEEILERIGSENSGEQVEGQREIEGDEVTIEEDSATAALSAEGQTATVCRVDDDWLIAALDFSAATGEPPAGGDEPPDCGAVSDS